MFSPSAGLERLRRRPLHRSTAPAYPPRTAPLRSLPLQWLALVLASCEAEGEPNWTYARSSGDTPAPCEATWAEEEALEILEDLLEPLGFADTRKKQWVMLGDGERRCAMLHLYRYERTSEALFVEFAWDHDEWDYWEDPGGFEADNACLAQRGASSCDQVRPRLPAPNSACRAFWRLLMAGCLDREDQKELMADAVPRYQTGNSPGRFDHQRLPRGDQPGSSGDGVDVVRIWPRHAFGWARNPDVRERTTPRADPSRGYAGAQADPPSLSVRGWPDL